MRMRPVGIVIDPIVPMPTSVSRPRSTTPAPAGFRENQDSAAGERHRLRLWRRFPRRL